MAAAIFWIKARAGWREKHDVVVREEVDPAYMTQEEADALLSGVIGETQMFVTAVHADLDLHTGTLDLVDAGHSLAVAENHQHATLGVELEEHVALDVHAPEAAIRADAKSVGGGEANRVGADRLQHLAAAIELDPANDRARQRREQLLASRESRLQTWRRWRSGTIAAVMVLCLAIFVGLRRR